AGIRMLWEAASDTPVVSFSFPYCSFTTAEEGEAVQTDIARILERAGFYHVANEPEFENLSTDLILSPTRPPDGSRMVQVAEARLRDSGFQMRHPILSYAMHAIYESPAEWQRFET